MADIPLRTVTRTQGANVALKDGKVAPAGFTLDFEEVPVITQAFRRMVRGLEFDVSEMSFTTYLCAKAHGKPFTALPVFLVRGFHHGAVLTSQSAGARARKTWRAAGPASTAVTRSRPACGRAASSPRNTASTPAW